MSSTPPTPPTKPQTEYVWLVDYGDGWVCPAKYKSARQSAYNMYPEGEYARVAIYKVPKNLIKSTSAFAGHILKDCSDYISDYIEDGWIGYIPQNKNMGGDF